MKDYHINIFYSDEDRGYIHIPGLEACSAFPKPPKGVAEVEIARVARSRRHESGKRIPKPRYRPVIYRVLDEGGKV